jgi:glutamyl-tRNA synthetase
MIRGEVTFHSGLLDDFVILKSDGYPTYHLASVVDDHFMNITHVLRADEWLSSTPKHLLLYRSLGWQPPQFAHLPMILGPDRSKLSKRHGAAALTDYRKQGFLPEAIFNFLALLGWSLDDKTEILSLEELVKLFSLQRVGKSAAIFNKDKLEWMNGIYLRQIDLEDFTKRALPFLDESLPAEVKRPLDNDYVKQVMFLVQERARSLADVPELTSFFFLDDIEYDTGMLFIKGVEPQAAARALQVALEKLETLPAWDIDSLESTLRPLTTDLNLSASKLFGLLRVATTGRTAAPPLFQSMATLGRKKCIQRIKAALQKLNHPL